MQTNLLEWHPGVLGYAVTIVLIGLLGFFATRRWRSSLIPVLVLIAFAALPLVKSMWGLLYEDMSSYMVRRIFGLIAVGISSLVVGLALPMYGALRTRTTSRDPAL